MDLNTTRLLFDAGLFVLIWMVQLTIYPSFLYFEKQNLFKWHTQYLAVFSRIVIPLMFGQLIIAGMQVFKMITMETVVSLLLVLLVWISTFIQFVPIHNKISKNEASDALLKQLVSKNWIRTILWSLILCWSIYCKL